MKVILLEDVKALGKKGQTVDVSDGYARNCILPKKLGVEANAKNLNDLKLQKAHEAKVAKATAQNKAYVHTKRIQMAEKEARYLAKHGQLPDADAELDTTERNSMPFDD